ncbi:MAG TPA: hypothetical protein DDY32_13170 [Desulfobulbaceae bacterium]|nr:hypothetical protein [Desulfobulbaceae bacterium]
MAVLSQSLQRSNLYKGVNINLAGDGHKLHTKISIGNVTASSPTVTARKSNQVEVEYSVTTSSGRIIAKGIVKEDGISDAGTFWTTTLTSEMTQWFMMAVEDAMSKAAVQIPEQLAKSKQFLELAMADTTPNRPNTYKNIQNHLGNEFTETNVTASEKVPPKEKSLPSSPRAPAVVKKERLAVLDLESKYGVEKDFAEAISVIVRDEIHGHGIFEVMSREDIRAVASREALLQAMGCDEDGSCLVDFGRLIGTRFMVAGSIAKIGTTYTLSLRMLDTKGENAGLVNRVSEQCNCDENQLIKSVKNVAAGIMGKHPFPN